MANFDSLDASYRHAATHHGVEAEPFSDGERGYVEHVKSQRLSGFERFVIVGALLLLGIAGFTGHLMTPATDQITTSAITEPAAPHAHADSCREYSPYAERNC